MRERSRRETQILEPSRRQYAVILLLSALGLVMRLLPLLRSGVSFAFCLKDSPQYLELDNGLVEGFTEMPNAPEIQHAGSKAFYDSTTDRITLPPRELFASAEEYYATALHGERRSEIQFGRGHGRHYRFRYFPFRYFQRSRFD